MMCEDHPKFEIKGICIQYSCQKYICSKCINSHQTHKMKFFDVCKKYIMKEEMIVGLKNSLE